MLVRNTSAEISSSVRTKALELAAVPAVVNGHDIVFVEKVIHIKRKEPAAVIIEQHVQQ